MKFGHRGANQPVQETATGRVFITSQNHGYCVDPSTLDPDRVEKNLKGPIRAVRETVGEFFHETLAAEHSPMKPVPPCALLPAIRGAVRWWCRPAP